MGDNLRPEGNDHLSFLCNDAFSTDLGQHLSDILTGSRGPLQPCPNCTILETRLAELRRLSEHNVVQIRGVQTENTLLKEKVKAYEVQKQQKLKTIKDLRDKLKAAKKKNEEMKTVIDVMRSKVQSKSDKQKPPPTLPPQSSSSSSSSSSTSSPGQSQQPPPPPVPVVHGVTNEAGQQIYRCLCGLDSQDLDDLLRHIKEAMAHNSTGRLVASAYCAGCGYTFFMWDIFRAHFTDKHEITLLEQFERREYARMQQQQMQRQAQAQPLQRQQTTQLCQNQSQNQSQSPDLARCYPTPPLQESHSGGTF